MQHPDPAGCQDTTVGRLAHRWLVDNGPPDTGKSEQETADRADRLKLPAITLADVDAKLLPATAATISRPRREFDPASTSLAAPGA
ncbi:hypothetical protein [Azospirillum largimobile]